MLVDWIVLLNERLVHYPAALVQQSRDELRHRASNCQMVAAKLKSIFDLGQEHGPGIVNHEALVIALQQCQQLPKGIDLCEYGLVGVA